MVHRDIKPANLLVMRDGRIKISDFGVARIESSTLTQTGAMLGTPSYMSPEQFRCEAVDGRSDLFSAGIVLYQLLTGKRPFSGSASTSMQQILNHTPPQPSMFNAALPAGFDSIVMRALAKQPVERFSSARAFLQALLATRQGQAGAIADADSDATILVTPAAAQLFTATLGGLADLTTATTTTAVTMNNTLSTLGGASVAAPAAPVLTAAFSAAIVPRLALWIGLIAAIVAKRAARECGEGGDLEAFLRLLALHIDSEAERQRFIGEARRSASGPGLLD